MMRTRRIIDEAIPEAGTGSCGLRAVCRVWRAPEACARCRRNPLGGGAVRGGAGIAQRLSLVDGEPSAVLALRWRVHHDLPNRTRFRLAGGSGTFPTAAVERAAEAVPGVLSARFSRDTGSLLVVHDGADSTRRELRRALELVRCGDEAEAPEREAERGAWRVARNEVMKAAVLSLVGAVLPPGPRAALKLVQVLSAARAARPPRTT